MSGIAAASPLVRPMSHTAKSHSISSLPLPTGLRMTSTLPSSPMADGFGAISPSRLPATDSMSYFPPFESMGSGPSSSPSDTTSEAGPSSRPHSVHDQENRAGHGKGRSLGSLAGLMSFLSPVTSPRKESSYHAAPAPLRSNSDGDVLQALARRVSPGKRRVLEPMSTITNIDMPEVEEKMASRHRRRRTSSDADRTGRSPRRRSPGKSMDGVEDIMVRRSVCQPGNELTEQSASRTRRRNRPLLNMTLPALPSWRFPMPSPPVTSLSPDIPLSAFSPIDNPASGPSSTDSSPAKPLTPSSLCFNYTYDPNDHDHDDNDDDQEEIIDDLSPTTSNYGTLSSGPSRPLTPHEVCVYDHEETSPRSFRTYDRSARSYSRLERSVSQASCDSKETIRPSSGTLVTRLSDGELTPKAVR